MPFQESSSSLKAKLHLSRIKAPVLVGVTALAAVVCAAAIAAVAFGFSHPFGQGEPAQGELAVEPAAEAEAAPEEAAPVVVHVGGAVQEPGVYELEQGSRVLEAVDEAGGFLPDASADALNLARVVQDGEQIIVPTLGQAQEGSASSGGGQAGSGQKVNINSATAEQLDTLPGVGESTAEKIIADREANGPFSSIEDLKRVSGIGDRKYAELADLICV